MHTPKSMPRIGPTIPELREYVTDVGTVVVNYAQLERAIRHTIDVAEGLEAGGVVKVPEEFKAVRAQKGKRTLGRLLKELKALGIDSEIAQKLGQVNVDRIGVIHNAARLTDEDRKFDFAAIEKERVRIRELLAREREVYTLIQEAEYRLFAGFLEVAERSLKGGATDPRLAPLKENLRQLRAMIDWREQT